MEHRECAAIGASRSNVALGCPSDCFWHIDNHQCHHSSQGNSNRSRNGWQSILPAFKPVMLAARHVSVPGFNPVCRHCVLQLRKEYLFRTNHLVKNHYEFAQVLCNTASANGFLALPVGSKTVFQHPVK